jgi:hypothetical protein
VKLTLEVTGVTPGDTTLTRGMDSRFASATGTVGFDAWRIQSAATVKAIATAAAPSIHCSRALGGAGGVADNSAGATRSKAA